MNISPQYKLKIIILDQWITSQECIKFTLTLVLVECFPLTQAQRAPHLSRHKQLGCSDSSRSFLSTFIVQTPHYSILLSDNKTQEGPWGRWRKAEGQRQYLSTGAPVERETKTNWICSLRRGANIMVLSSRCAGFAVRPDKANCLSNLWCCKTAWNRGGEEGSSSIPLPFQVPMSQTASLATHVAVIG